VQIVRHRNIAEVSLESSRRIDCGHNRYAFGLASWRPPQQDRADHAEHRGVNADTKRQGQNSDRRKSRILHQLPYAVAQVLTKAIHDLPLFLSVWSGERSFFRQVLLATGNPFFRQDFDWN